MKLLSFSVFTLLITLDSTAQWAWLNGNKAASWGTRGVASINNQPGPRSSYASCSDNNGNIWMFGGSGNDINGDNVNLNDLWKYNSFTNEWTWVSGSNEGSVNVISTYGTKGVPDSENVPGVRTNPEIWADALGKIWIWGGNGFDADGNNGRLNDLWTYDPVIDQWSWMNGSNKVNDLPVYGIRGIPDNNNQPGYMGATTSTDKLGNLWLSGSNNGFEIWKYDLSTNQWTFLGRNNTYGVYGTKGVPAADNVPGNRSYYLTVFDSGGNLWLFGGSGFNASSSGQLNDLWQYNPTTDKWVWVSGSDKVNQIGIYGKAREGNINNHPGGRNATSISFDGLENLFVYGGFGYSGSGTNGSLNDLWNYNVSSGNWTWLSGSRGTGQAAVYGTQGIPASENHPSAGYGGFSFVSSNKIFLYGVGNGSEIWSFTTNKNVAPTVNITSPKDSAVYTGPADILLNADASDADGTIIYVQFYNGTDLLKTDSTSPYIYSWTDVAEGNYTIVAKTKDNAGLITQSPNIIVSVVKNKTPVVSITRPGNNEVYISPADVTISVAASDTDGTIKHVQLFNDTTLLQTDTTSPFSFIWTNLSAGIYRIIAKASDNLGLISISDSVNILVLEGKAPAVNITSPTNNKFYNSPATITVSASATDIDGKVSYVEFYMNGRYVASDSTKPYNYTFSNLLTNNYLFEAKAIDNSGLTGSSATVFVSVLSMSNMAPVVAVTHPVNNATFIGPATIDIDATASDPDGMIKIVKFFNGATLIATDSTSPYSCTIPNAMSGTYRLYIQAIDNKGLATSSSTVTAFIVNGSSEKFPLVSIVSPVNNLVYPLNASIILHANANDLDGNITNVKFYNGSNLLKTDSSSPYSCTISHPPAGLYSFVAQATDNSGLSSNSATVTVGVASSTIKAPTINIISPANNANFISPSTITINATSSDPDGSIIDVKFYNGSKLLKIDSTNPYSYTMPNAVTGTYKFYAKATDNSGLSNSSRSVSIAVLPGTSKKAPDIILVSPINNAIYYTPGSITIKADATDKDGKVANVKFYSGSKLLFVDTAAPYSYTLNDLPTGIYSIVAKVTGSNGLTSNSATAVVMVNPLPSKGPNVEIVNIVNNTIFSAPVNITLKAIASDDDGSIVNVKFYNGTTLLKVDSIAPFSYTLNNASAGNYNFTAKAEDNSGSIGSSSSVFVVVTSQHKQICASAFQPTFGLRFNDRLTANINNGSPDAGESASITVCSGGQYSTSEYFSSSPLNLYNITVVKSGGTLLLNGITDNNRVFTSSDFLSSVGTYSLTLADSNVAGTLVQTVTPFIDLNNNGVFDTTDCAGDPIVYSYTVLPCTSSNCSPNDPPTFSYYFGGKIVSNINNGILDTSEVSSVTICNGGNYLDAEHVNSNLSTLYDLNIISRLGGTLLVNGTIYASAVITAADFIRMQGLQTLTLADPNVGGTVVEAITPFLDLNNNLVLDAGDCIGDPTVKSYTGKPCRNTSLFSTKSTTGHITNLVKPLIVRISPNPAHDILNVYTRGLPTHAKLTMSIISTSGIVMKTVQKMNQSQLVQLNVSTLTNGMYIIKILSEDEVMYSQFMKF